MIHCAAAMDSWPNYWPLILKRPSQPASSVRELRFNFCDRRDAAPDNLDRWVNIAERPQSNVGLRRNVGHGGSRFLARSGRRLSAPLPHEQNQSFPTPAGAGVPGRSYMLPPDISFRANPDERRTGPREPSSLLGSRLYIAVFGACLFHAGVLLFLLFVNWEPIVDPTPQEIPIEIVVEPPPQEKPDPPPPPPDPPAPTTRSIDEDPAFDAPRTASNEKIERDAPDQASKAPPAPTPTEKPGAGAAPGGETGPVRQGELQAADHAAEPAMEKPDAEIVKKAEPDHDQSEQQQASVDAKPEPQKLPSLVGQSLPSWTSGQLPTFEPMPDVELGSLAKASPIDGGKAKTTYLTIVYGLVMARMHLPPGVHGDSSKLEGVLLFSVDGAGKLTQNQIVRPSGSRDLDAAAVAAVSKAAPFPTPPQGAPIGMRFSYSAK